jgi:hypothetical protein
MLPGCDLPVGFHLDMIASCFGTLTFFICATNDFAESDFLLYLLDNFALRF